MSDSGLSAITDADAVHVVLRSPLPPAEVWPALADTGRLAQWFGELNRPWQPGQPARVEFGDGDFFDIDPLEVVPGAAILFEWRFLGVGPTARVRWQCRPAATGTEVVIDDVQPGRTPAETDELLSGWTDFAERLTRYLRTGRRSRYGTRDDIDGTVTVGPSAAGLIEPDTIHRWLPIATDGFTPSWFFVIDDDGPRRFAVDRWTAEPGAITFAVEVPGATRITSARIQLDQAGAEWHLSFRHTGWSRLGLPDRQARLLRSRFTAAWVAALHDARDLADSD